MHSRLSILRTIPDRVRLSSHLGLKVNPEQAEQAAKEILKWAKQNGVTHYSFWVQPLTHETMEKHDAFFELEYVFEGSQTFLKLDKFDGRTLLKG